MPRMDRRDLRVLAHRTAPPPKASAADAPLADETTYCFAMIKLMLTVLVRKTGERNSGQGVPGSLAGIGK